jgi:hypothetical protein
MAAILKFKDRYQLQEVQKSHARKVQASAAQMIVNPVGNRFAVQKHLNTQVQEIQKAATFDASSQYMHGPQVEGYGGLLNTPGVDSRVISTIPMPIGISDLIPAIADRIAFPLFEMLTQLTDVSGSEATTLADRSKIVGKLKTFRHTATYGRIIRSTETISPDKLGRLATFAEPMDLQLVNATANSSPWVPEAARNLTISNEMATEWWKLGMAFRRQLEIWAFQGAGTNSGTNAGYIEPYGLQTLVNTGKTDALSGQAVLAADPKVITWNALFDANVTVENKSMDLVSLMARLMYYMMARADDTDMNPIGFVLAMRRDLFIQLIDFWPYTYLTAGPSGSTSKTIVTDSGDATSFRDAMRQGQFLRINGIDVPVIFAEGIPETATGAGVKSDIYWLTLTARGMRMLYWNYFDYSNQQVQSLMARFPRGELMATDAGKFLWTFDRTNYVAYFQAMLEPRLVLRSAFLCARITGINYPTALHTLDALPGAIYEAPGGGITSGSLGSGFYTGNP